MSGKVLAKWAAVAAMACAGVAMADSATDVSLAPTSSQQPVLADAAAPRKPLMWLLDKAGIAKTLDEWNINVYGYAEGSVTYSTSNPPNSGVRGHQVITGRAFDFEHEDPTFNQAALTIERTVDASKKAWDVGFNTTWIWGSDSRLIHSNGLDFYGPNSAGGNKDKHLGPGIENDPENQFDLNQAYVDIAVPLGTGLRLRVGKFDTLAGEETINPTTNLLYSHSFLFAFAEPLTQTGLYGTYVWDAFTFDLGFDRGWDQSLVDNNSAIEGFGRVSWASADKKTNVAVLTICGPNLNGDSGEYRTLIDVVASYQYSDQLLLAVNGDYVYGSNEQGLAGGEDPGHNAQYYGLAGYASYKINDYFTANGRLEWFSDQDGARISTASQYYEGTLGVACTPFPNDAIGSNWKIRPEVRCDYATHGVFDGGTQNTQVTGAVETYFTY